MYRTKGKGRGRQGARGWFGGFSRAGSFTHLVAFVLGAAGAAIVIEAGGLRDVALLAALGLWLAIGAVALLKRGRSAAAQRSVYSGRRAKASPVSPAASRPRTTEPHGRAAHSSSSARPTLRMIEGGKPDSSR